MKRTTRYRRTGFTLIELLLVMVILVVLAAIIMPSFTGRSRDARIVAAKQQISNFETSLEAFENDTGRYPTTEEGLQALVVQPAGVDNWHQLLKAVPLDPWKNPYQYHFPGSHNTIGPDIFSMGPDGHEGGGDDIDNWSVANAK